MIIHVMNDGTIRESVEGLTIHSEQFYKILHEIHKKYRLKGATQTK